MPRKQKLPDELKEFKRLVRESASQFAEAFCLIADRVFAEHPLPKIEVPETPKLISARKPMPLEKAYFSIPEAAKFSGIASKSIRNLLDAGKLTRYRPLKRRVVISRAEFENYLRTSR